MIADLSYTTKCPKPYVWVHRPKKGEREKGSEKGQTGRYIFTFSFLLAGRLSGKIKVMVEE